MLVNDGWSVYCKIALRRMSLDPTSLLKINNIDPGNGLVPLGQCWSRFISPHGVTWPQVLVTSWVWYGTGTAGPLTVVWWHDTLVEDAIIVPFVALVAIVFILLPLSMLSLIFFVNCTPVLLSISGWRHGNSFRITGTVWWETTGHRGVDTPHKDP